MYDVSRFANLHPGGAAVLFADSIGAHALPDAPALRLLTPKVALHSREGLYASLLWPAPPRNTPPTPIRAAADRNNPGRAGARTAARAGCDLRGTLRGTNVAREGVSQPLLHRGAPHVPTGGAEAHNGGGVSRCTQVRGERKADLAGGGGQARVGVLRSGLMVYTR